MEHALHVGEEAARRAGHPGVRVVLCHIDPLDALLHVLGCWRHDLIPVLLHDGTPPRKVAEVAHEVGAAAVRSEDGWSDPPEGTHVREVPDPAEALVLTTSGTTGAPKLVALPDRSVRRNAESIGRALGIDAADRLLVATPLSHAYGLVGMCVTALWAGASMHLFAAGTTATILQRRIRNDALTVVQGTPSFYRLFLGFWSGRPFPSVRVWTVAGDASSPELRAKLAEAFPAAVGLIGFGMTEAGPRVSHLPVTDPRADHGGVGVPFDHLQWSIRPAADGAPDGVGRLVLRGESMFLGYVEPTGYSGVDDDGFFTTSDLVRRDDRGGLIHLGRSDSRVKIGGRLVSHEEIDDIRPVLLGLPGVRDARCHAEPHPLLGHALVAEVAAAPGAVLDGDALRTACRERLDAPLVPHEIRIVDELTSHPKRK